MNRLCREGCPCSVTLGAGCKQVRTNALRSLAYGGLISRVGRGNEE